MKTCEYDGAPFTEPRSHPWTDSASCADYRYVDLKADPSQIRTSLEDFVPWGHHAAIDDFYALVEWVNGPRSTLESNDCAFTGPHANESPSFAKALQCSGRIMVLFSALARNLSRPGIESFKDSLHHRLGEIDAAFSWGIIGTTILPVRYVTLPGPAKQQLGYQLMISFWAWGSREEELMTNLGRVLRNLSQALQRVVASAN
ncbi:MAG: hypothetical protein ACLQBL_20760 [Polyangiaceae bacterium]